MFQDTGPDAQLVELLDEGPSGAWIGLLAVLLIGFVVGLLVYAFRSGGKKA